MIWACKNLKIPMISAVVTLIFASKAGAVTVIASGSIPGLFTAEFWSVIAAVIGSAMAFFTGMTAIAKNIFEMWLKYREERRTQIRWERETNGTVSKKESSVKD